MKKGKIEDAAPDPQPGAKEEAGSRLLDAVADYLRTADANCACCLCCGAPVKSSSLRGHRPRCQLGELAAAYAALCAALDAAPGESP